MEDGANDPFFMLSRQIRWPWSRGGDEYLIRHATTMHRPTTVAKLMTYEVRTRAPDRISHWTRCRLGTRRRLYHDCRGSHESRNRELRAASLALGMTARRRVVEAILEPARAR
jgi:hypothetical protein